jgi:putative superfamily III holin-X
VARPETDERSISELIQEASQQTATLVRQEIQLGKLELQEKGKHMGMGAGMFGGAGLVALYGVGALIAAAIMLLATALAAWLAALIVGAVLLLVAGVLALSGKKQVEAGTPPVPEQAVDSVQDDIDHVKARASRS